MFRSLSSQLMNKLMFWLVCVGMTALPVFLLPKTTDLLNFPKAFFLFVWVCILLLLWGISAILQKKLAVRKTMMSLPFIGFMVSAVLSCIFSVSQQASLLGNTESFTLTALTIFSSVLFSFLLIQIIRTRAFFSSVLQTFFLSSVLAQVIFFLAQTSLFQRISAFQSLGESFFQTVSSSNSVFGIWVASMGVLSAGFLFVKGRKWFEYVLPGMVVFMSFFTLLRLGFHISLLIYALGLGLLMILPFLFIGLVNRKFVLGVFFVFLGTLSTVLFPSMNIIKMNVPVEIALGSPASFDIVKQVLQSDAKHFLFGSGLGTFVYDFSLYRTPAFNTNAIVSTTRFYSPFSTFFALMAETGLLGIISFLLIIFIGLGALLSLFLEMRASKKQAVQQSIASAFDHSAHGPLATMLDVLVLGITWLCLTVGLFVSFFDLTVWWMWWGVLALVVVGLGFVNKKFVVDHDISLRVAPQYSLALSFGILFFFSLLVLSVGFGVRMYAAEYFFSKAQKVGSLAQAQALVQRSIEYRPTYATYHTALARIYLQQARVEFQSNSKNTQTITSFVVQGANEAKQATELDPSNVAHAESLALMYLNAVPFAPEALVWAKEALESAIVLEPSNALNHARLAEVFLQEKNIQAAEKEYLKSIELKFDYFPAYQSLVQLYVGQEKYDQAIPIHEALLKIAPLTPDLLYNHGLLFFNRQKGDDVKTAEALWLEVIKEKPDHVNTLYSLGLLYEIQGDRSKALSYYQKVRELVPKNEDVRKKIQSLLR